MSKVLFLLVVLFAAQASVAAYITDKLLAGYYSSPDLTKPPVRALPNGTPMEVLEERGNFSRVRLGDNSEGWVETRFITHEKPVKMMLLELQAKYATLKRQTENSTAEPTEERATAEPSAAVATAVDEMPETELPQSQQSQPDLEIKAEFTAATEQQLRREIVLLGDRLQRIHNLSTVQAATETHQRTDTFQPWVLPLIMLGLLLSFIAGIAFKNYRIARRAGQTGRNN